MQLFSFALVVGVAAAVETSDHHEEFMHLTCTAAADGITAALSLACNSTCSECEAVFTGTSPACFAAEHEGDVEYMRVECNGTTGAVVQVFADATCSNVTAAHAEIHLELVAVAVAPGYTEQAEKKMNVDVCQSSSNFEKCTSANVGKTQCDNDADCTAFVRNSDDEICYRFAVADVASCTTSGLAKHTLYIKGAQFESGVCVDVVVLEDDHDDHDDHDHDDDDDADDGHDDHDDHDDDDDDADADHDGHDHDDDDDDDADDGHDGHDHGEVDASCIAAIDVACASDTNAAGCKEAYEATATGSSSLPASYGQSQACRQHFCNVTSARVDAVCTACASSGLDCAKVAKTCTDNKVCEDHHDENDGGDHDGHDHEISVSQAAALSKPFLAFFTVLLMHAGASIFK